MENVRLSYDDITIVPEALTFIEHRGECNPFDERGMLPIFAAPMDTVVDENNYRVFINNRINVVIPRTVSYEKRMELLREGEVFVAFSKSEASKINFSYLNEKSFPSKLCIDIANGHMASLLALVKSLKETYGDMLLIMTGNIANPKAYKLFNEVGLDYIKCGIGGGGACLTSSNTGVSYPYFSLLEEIYNEKLSVNGNCKVIADGNIRGYRDVQKALINADYVMIGSLFNKAIESAADATYGRSYFNFNGFKVLRPVKTLFTYGRVIPREKYDKIIKQVKEGKLTVFKKFYGMSTKIAQEKMGNKVLKTSEGLIKYNKVEYSLEGWAQNETDYLRSAMSYTSSVDLIEYKKSSWVKVNTQRFNN